MRIKLTPDNQLTLPQIVINQFIGVDHFDVTAEAGRIILTPMRLHRADAVRAKLEEWVINEDDLTQAVQWARLKA